MILGLSHSRIHGLRAPRRYGLTGFLSLLLSGTLSGCTQLPPPQAAPSSEVSNEPLHPLPTPLSGQRTGTPISLTNGNAGPPLTRPDVQIGSGQFVDPNTGQPAQGQIAQSGNNVSLNFINVDVRDVMKSVIGGLLKQSYTVDPAVKGNVTLETPSPIPRASVIEVLTTALQQSGIGLVLRGDIYVAVPIANAARQATFNGVSGFVTRVVQLKYVSATELDQALQALIPPGAILKADPARNVLLISGTALDVATLSDDIASFDVDYLRGMSFALLPLRNGRARDVAADVNKMLSSASRTIGDMVKVAPIERMNAILVTAMQPAYLRRVEGWVARLDKGDGQAGRQLFIYRVQNSRAADLANVLRRALGIQSDSANAGGTQGGAASGANGGGFDITTPAPIGSTNSGLKGIQDALSGGTNNAAPSGSSASAARANPTGTASSPQADVLLAGGASEGGGSAPTSDVRVTADPTNNALVIAATPQEYAPIRAALQQLDVTPMQVLIEATVAEVSLTNQLSMGLQYYIKSGNFSAIFAPGLSAQSPSTSTPFPGFGLGGAANVLYASGGTNLVLKALQGLTTVHILSSPDLLVVNNETAKLQVGDQLPVATQSATSNLAPGAPTVNSISYRDTGVILEVTPRVNASGLVQIDMTEEVSAPKTTATSTTSDPIQSPTISTRRVTSTLAINDGQTVVLAGLIQQNDSNASSGLPWLHNIPVLGFLFGTKSDTLTRTELIVLITPHVIRNRLDADTVTNELRNTLRLTVPIAAKMR